MKKRKVLLSKCDFHWLRSYVIIVLAIMIVFSVYSAVIISQVKKDADENNRQFANYYHTIMEESLQSIQDYSATLLFSDNAKKLHMYREAEMADPMALSDAYDLVFNIRDFVLINNMLEDIYVYYPEIDHIIGYNGCFHTYTYYKSENVTPVPQHEAFQQWKNTVLDNEHAGFFTYSSPAGQDSIYYQVNTDFGFNNKPRVVVAKISKERLDAYFSEMLSNISYEFAGLVDDNGNLYAQAGNAEFYTNQDGQYEYQNSNHLICYEVKSDLWPLTFVTVQNFATAYKIVKTTGNILIVGLIATLLVGVLLAGFYASKNMQDVDKIVRRFDSGDEGKLARNFEYIGTEIDKLIDKNRQAIQAVEQQEKMIGSFFLQELLRRENVTEKDVGRLCAMYHISLENPLFSLVIAWRQEGALNHDALLDFADAAADDNFVVYWAPINQLAVFLCNYEARTKSPQGPVLEFAKQMRSHCACQVEISPVMESAGGIAEAWKQLRKPFIPEISPVVEKPAVDDGLTILREFNDAIDRDDLTTAIAIVPDLNRKFLAGRNENLTLCRRYTLLGKLYEAYSTDSLRLQTDELMELVRTSQWEQKLITLLERIDRDVNRKVDMRQVAEIAKDMIDAEYSNPQLGLQMIAEHIGVSQSYLSRLFKTKYSMSVIQYLNYVRIEEAKQQMLAGKENLKVIAMNVGFSSDVSLIRVFKKFENTTPGNFRNRD